jgi:molybdate transport repressor ModE-like protein
LVAAASRKATKPLLQIGSIPIIKRIVITFREAGIFPIVIVTGTQEAEVKYQLAASGVIFLYNEHNEEPELLESVKIGLSFLRDTCDRVVFSPVNVPLFSADTVQTLLSCPDPIVTPTYRQHGGHPVVLSNDLIPSILDYEGPDGLGGFIKQHDTVRRCVEVPDDKILETVNDERQLHRIGSGCSRPLPHPVVDLSLETDRSFCNSRCKLLLLLIAQTGSVKQACSLMALSPGKAWQMINDLEQELGKPVVERHRGGSGGGTTTLSAFGTRFLRSYRQLEEQVAAYARERSRDLEF